MDVAPALVAHEAIEARDVAQPGVTEVHDLNEGTFHYRNCVDPISEGASSAKEVKICPPACDNVSVTGVRRCRSRAMGLPHSAVCQRTTRVMSPRVGADSTSVPTGEYPRNNMSHNEELHDGCLDADHA